MQEEAKRLREEIEELKHLHQLCGVSDVLDTCEVFPIFLGDVPLTLTPQFSIIIRPLFESFNGAVSTTSTEELCQSTLRWLECHCSLPVLRP
ncbi:hypothetical protein JZ751_013004, partial [Albula glossodonta]